MTAASEHEAMQKHVREQTAALLRRLAYAANRGAKSVAPDGVHDLRVAIRRLSLCLKLFSQFLPPAAVKKIRRNLKDLMELSSEVRNRDVALAFLAKAEVPPDSVLVTSIAGMREEFERRLRIALRGWSRRHKFRKWRADLELQNS
ncbi:MAG: CHAD domain-containing protein [Bryobacteraceae bacterium]